MADSDPIHRVQFGEGIYPVKSAGAYSTAHKEPSISEKAGYDVEDRAAQIADVDLNQKKKQVSLSHQSLKDHFFQVAALHLGVSRDIL